MKDKILFFFFGATLVTLVYFANDIRQLANPFIKDIKGNLVSLIALGLTIINTSILVYVLKITKDNEKK